MAHSVTDAEGKLHKIAGNFNPSYNVSQLVREKVIDTATNSVTIDSLDLVQDGGVYDFQIIWKQTGSYASYVYMIINDNTATSYTNILKYYGGTNGGTYAGSWERNQSKFKIGHSGTYGNFLNGTILCNKDGTSGILFECENGSYGGDTNYNMTFNGRNPGLGNIKKLTFTLDQNFAVGTTIRIYKRMANATVVNASGGSFLNAHPIGSYYITEESESPVDKYGGGWLQIQGKFLLGATDGTDQADLTALGYGRSSSNYHYWLDSAGNRHNITVVGNESGEVYHLLTQDEMPNHTHSTNDGYTAGATTGTRDVLQSVSSNRTGWGNLVGYSGGSKSHNNMPPYRVVNIWKRIS